MKQQLLALSLIASAGLIADDGMNRDAPKTTNQNGYCNTCCCTPCCCKPQPTECVSGVAYTAPFYDLQCDWGAFFDVEFLYWYARETDLSYAMTFTNVERSLTNEVTTFAPSTYKYIDSRWDPGFRVGLGWNSECDGWDVYLNYTWMRNRKTTSTSVPEFGVLPEVGDQGILNPWINQSFHFQVAGNQQVTRQPILLFSKVAAKWRLQWNQIDLELGRKYWLSSCFNLRPYAGLRGAWWKTRFRTTSTKETAATGSTDTATFDFKFVDRFTNRVWGVGVLGGLQPTWYVSCCFAIYGNFDVALIWGDFEAKKRERYTQPETETTNDINYVNRSKGQFPQMTPVLDTGIGVRWEENWCCDRYRTTLDLGWEHHVYFDQNHRMKSFDNYASSSTSPINTGFGTYAPEAGNIGFGGFVLRARFDF